MVFIAHAIHLDEVVGKVARNNGQEQSPVARADIAKGVWDITRADHDRSGGRRHLLVADRHLELSVEDVENLRLVVMNMQRRPMASGDFLLERMA
jgi:hypothetical protein